MSKSQLDKKEKTDQVPDGWLESRLDHFAILQRGYDLPVQDRKGGNIPIYGSNGIVGYHNKVSVEGPGVLTGRSGSIGDVFYIEEDFWALNTSLYIKEFHGNDRKFVYYYLDWFDLRRFGSGTGVPTLNRNDVHSISIVYPPLAEQQKIATILSSVDNVIEKTRTQIDKLKDLKTGMMQELLTKGIGHTEFKDSPVGRIPKDWNVYKQGSVAEFVNGRAYKLSEWESEGVPVIRLQNLTGSGNDFYYSNLTLPEKQYCHKGDLLYMWSATFGPHIWLGDKAIYHYHIWKVQVDVNYLTKMFFFYLLDFRTQQWKEQSANGMGILHITKGAMEEMEIALPSVLEQNRIVHILCSIDKRIKGTNKKLISLEQMKKSLMQNLLTGCSRV